MTDIVISIQDIKTELEKTRHNLAGLSFEEVTTLTMEKISNNLIIIADTLENTVDVVKVLVTNNMQLQEQIEKLENDLEVLL